MLVAYADRDFEGKGSFRATLSAVWYCLPALRPWTRARTVAR